MSKGKIEKLNRINTESNSKPLFQLALMPLLKGLNWPGDKTVLREAMPFDKKNFDMNSILSTMANLGYNSTIFNLNMQDISTENTPAIFIKNDNVFVLLKKDSGYALVFNTQENKYQQICLDTEKIKFIFFYKPIDKGISIDERQPNWFRRVFSKFSVYISISFFISLILTILALLVPLFIILVFSQITSSSTITPLIYLSYGVALYVAAIFVFSLIRFNILNYVSSRLGYILDKQIIRRIFYLPIVFTEKADTASQLARIKDFRLIQKFISGRTAASMLDLPFQIILIAALFIIGGPIGFVPITAIVIFIIFGKIVNHFVKTQAENYSEVFSKKHSLTMEILANYEAIKETNSEKIWLDRYKEVSSRSSLASLSSEKLNTFINNFTAFLVSTSGMATITVGAIRVVEGSMTAGALMASMILTWKILNPLRSGFTVLSQVNKLKKSILQVDKLMSLNIESKATAGMFQGREVKGNITFDQVSIRYLPESPPALLGASFDIKPGELVQVIGHEGAGKSTILKLILNLYTPQAGRVLIDGINLRQMNPIMTRKMINFVPENFDFIEGTIAENISLQKPDASQNEIMDVAKTAMVLNEIEALPDKFNTVIDSQLLELQGRNFINKINFARILLNNNSIILLDEVNRFFSKDENKNFENCLQKLKGKKTVILISNNNNITKIADKILVIDSSKVDFFGTPQEYQKGT